ncbi:ABC transporter substrate-binding protein [Streptomyces sp. NPDC059740]|uniref:peptide ABC transporter substrate-binding protein n=1 Tax=Streptomyces sp. NPDC059740 TaxID=3346926 RepID=UPI00365B4799
MRGAKSATWVAGAIVIALSATACGGGGGSGDDKAAIDPNGVYSYDDVEPQNPLIPTNTNEVAGHYILANVFRGLVQYDAKGNLVNEVAQSVDTKDSKVWDVKLKPGWTFSNGEKVTSDSFIDAWNWGANVKNNQLNASWFEPIQGYSDVHPDKGDPKADKMSGLKKISDTEFTITLSHPVATFKHQLYYDPFFPLPKVFYKDTKAFGEHPIGNGPYKMVGDWQHKVGVKVRKVKNFAGDDKPKNGGIDFVFSTSPDAAYNNLVSNKLDIMYQVPPSALTKYKTDLNGRAVQQVFGGNTAIGFPMYQKAWQKPEKAKVRQGLSMAIDRATIAKTVLKGSKTAADGWVPPSVDGYTKDECGGYCKFDPKKAKQLIKEGGGVPGGKLVINVNTDGGGNKDWATAVCNDIQQNAGVPCTLKTWSTFGAMRTQITDKKMDQPFRMAWVQDYLNITDFIQAQYQTGAGANDMAYSSKKVDSLIKEADAAPSVAESNKKYQEVTEQMAKDMPSIPLFFDETNGGWSQNVTNVKFDSFRQAIWTDVEVKKK